MPYFFCAQYRFPRGANWALTIQPNERFRQIAWPKPFDKTSHTLSLGDARDLSAISDGSVHLVVTSPPYWTLKDYPGAHGQLGDFKNYSAFLDELDKVWRACFRVLVLG